MKNLQIIQLESYKLQQSKSLRWKNDKSQLSVIEYTWKRFSLFSRHLQRFCNQPYFCHAHVASASGQRIYRFGPRISQVHQLAYVLLGLVVVWRRLGCRRLACLNWGLDCFGDPVFLHRLIAVQPSKVRKFRFRQERSLYVSWFDNQNISLQIYYALYW